MNPLFLGPILELFGKLSDKVWPDPEKKAQAQAELIRMQMNGELESVRVQLSAIVAEAQSSDPWTSRARPGFLYVIYILILMGIPMGFVSAFRPDIAAAVANGLKLWLGAIPQDLYVLFGAGYLGYTGGRSLEKLKGTTK